MAGFPARSTSMPSRPHPLPVGIEEELNKLKTHGSSWSSSAEAMLGALEGLGIVYALIADLLRLPLGRKAVAHLRKESFIEEMLDGYVRLLDACNTIRDSLLLAKEGAQGVHTALRRRGVGVDVAVACEVDAYLQLRKNMKKDVDRCLRFLKFKDGRCSSLVLDMDENIPTILRAIAEANNVSISILRSFLFFISSRRSTETMKKKSKWSLVSTTILKGAAAKKGVAGEQMLSEFEGADTVVYTFYKHLQGKEVTDEFVNIAQKRLESMYICIEKLVDATQSMFRKIIQNRVSLLNILSM